MVPFPEARCSVSDIAKLSLVEKNHRGVSVRDTAEWVEDCPALHNIPILQDINTLLKKKTDRTMCVLHFKEIAPGELGRN